MALKASLGEDWTDFFDLVLTGCRKPLFQRALNPFVPVSDMKNHDEEEAIRN